MMRWSGLPGVAIAVGLALAAAACGPGQENTPDAEPVTTQEERSESDDAERSKRGDEDDREEPQQAGESNDLDIQQRHPNGSVLRVLGVSLGATSIGVEVEALNGFTAEIVLNNRGVHLVDDLGNAYNFVEPEQNSSMKVAPGAVLSGTLTFIGRVEEDATSLRLLINTYDADETVDTADEYDKTNSPAFQIDDIPIPGR